MGTADALQIACRGARRVSLLKQSGTSYEETAEATGMSQRSVSRTWRFARSFLAEMMDS